MFQTSWWDCCLAAPSLVYVFISHMKFVANCIFPFVLWKMDAQKAKLVVADQDLLANTNCIYPRKEALF